MKKLFALIVTFILLLVAGLALFAGPATAAEICTPKPAVAAYDETVVDTAAYDETVIVTDAYDETVVDTAAGWQRYSWTGGPHESDSAPGFPSDDWQANTASDPHGIGVAGAYFRSNGNSGKGDWFYLEATPEVTHVVHHDAVTKVVHHDAVTHIVHHDAIPAVVCPPDEDTFDAYEVCATWTVDNVPTNVSDWPQTNFDKGLGADCDQPAQTCEPQRTQFDKYWIRDAEDEAYFEDLNRMDSPADDASLEPHGYYMTNIDAKDCTEPPVVIQPSCTTVTGTDTIEGDGVISVPGGWASNTIPVPFSGSLKDIGTVLNIDATPLQYVGLHIHTAEGTIVFEEEASYAGQLWSNDAWAGVSAGLGYAALGTIEQFIAQNGDVAVTGIDLLYTHPEASSTTVSSFTIGCTTYTFVPEVIVPEQPEPRVTTQTRDETICYAESGTVETSSENNATLTTYGTDTTFPVTYDAESNTWVEGEGVVGEEYVISTFDVYAANCDKEEPPVVEPPVVQPPVVKPPAVVPPVVQPPVAVVATVSDDQLASTGVNNVQVLMLTVGGLALLGVFFLLVAAWRRRTDQLKD